MTAEVARATVGRITEDCKGGIRWRWDARLRTGAGLGYSFPGSIATDTFHEMFRGITSPLTLVYGTNSEMLCRGDVEVAMRVAPEARAMS